MDMREKLNEVEARRKKLYEGGGAEAAKRQHEMTKLTVRERIDRLFDKGSFQEIDLWVRPIKTGFDVDERDLPADAVVTGMGRINGRPVYVYAHDFTVLGGTFGAALRHKVARIMELARDTGIPLIGVVDSGGERIHDRFGFTAIRPILGGSNQNSATGVYFHPGINSGVIPQVTVMLGPSYAGSAYSPTMADFYVMRNRTAFMSVASPELLKSVTFANVSQEELGGATLHATTTGNADFLTETDDEAIGICRELMGYLPLNNRESSPVIPSSDPSDRREERLLDIVPADLARPYDMHDVIKLIVDDGRFLEIQKLFASSMIIGFARFSGRAVGIVANNPASKGGILDTNTSDKQARFIRFCDAFSIPLVFLVDTPGFQTSVEDEQSRNGLLRTAPKPAFAICEATVPMVTVFIGKCFGPARMMMGTPRMGVDFTAGWPSARVGRMSPEEAAGTIYREEIAAAPDPARLLQEKTAEITRKYYSFPFHAAEQVMVNDIIDPRDTRPFLVNMLENLSHKKPSPRPWRKHSLIPR